MVNKGQVTLFAIVGVSLLLAFSILFYLMIQGTPDIFDEVQDSSVEKNSLQIFVESCLQMGAEEGLEIIRLQGGYIEFPSGVITTDIDSNLTVEEGRLVKEKGKVKVPHYMSDNQLSVPMLELTQEQLENFVNERMVECVDDFKELKDQGYEVIYGEVNSSVDFGENTIVDLDFSVNVSKGENTLNEDQFSFVIPINYLEMYRKAFKLTLYEYVNGFLERHAKRLISLYSFNGKDEQYSLPPLGLTIAGLECNKKTWSQEEAKETLQKVFEANYPNLKIARLNYTKIIADDAIAQGVYDTFVEDLLEKDLSTHLDLSYKAEYGMDGFKVEPSSGGMIEPDEAEFDAIPMIAMLCSHKYNFKYSFTNPILFEMWDVDNDKYIRTSAPQGTPFKLNFFMESYLCGNNAKICTGKSPYAAQIDEILGKYQTATSICENTNSGDVLLTVKDNSNAPLSGVNINYYCGSKTNDCPLGSTNNQGELSTKLPYCENGILTFSKQGYFDFQEIQSIRHGYDRRYTFSMAPTSELKYNASLIKIKDFALAYQQTAGFTSNTCDGRTPQVVFDSLLNEPSLTDMITINMKDPKNFFSPTMSISGLGKMPTRITIPPTKYQVSSSYMGIVTIKPVFVDDGQGGKIEISVNSDGTGDYKGVWMLGNNQYDFDLDSKDLEDKKEIELFILVNFLPGDNLNVDSIKQEFINENGLMDIKIAIPANSLPSEGCSNAGVTKNVLIPKSRYEPIIKPRLK